MRDLAPTLPTAQAPQGYIDRQTIQQLPRGIQMEHRFGDKGPRDGPPVPGRPTHAARPGGDQPLNLNHAQHRCQLTMLVRQRAQLLIERREQYALQDAMKLIQKTGNGKLHTVETPFTLELVAKTLF